MAQHIHFLLAFLREEVINKLVLFTNQMCSALLDISHLNFFQWDIIGFIYITIQIGDLWCSLLNIPLEYYFVNDCSYKTGWKWTKPINLFIGKIQMIIWIMSYQYFGAAYPMHMKLIVPNGWCQRPNWIHTLNKQNSTF